jgi:NAD(P)-dependent dehydrogenase (short-subunit alcohol dehydrogenase family)
MAPLQGKKILVIGGSSGIGFSVAKAALAEGAEVIIASSSTERVRDAVSRLGENQSVVAEQVDITNEASVVGLFNRVSALDHLVLTVGRILQSLQYLTNASRLVASTSAVPE